MKRMLALMLLLILPVFIGSCAEDEDEGTKRDPQASRDKTDLAAAAAFEQMNAESPDFTAAYNLFVEAVALDPGNLDAHLGAGLTNMLRMPNHPAIQQLIAELDLGDLFKLSWGPRGFKSPPAPVEGIRRVILGPFSGEGVVDEDMGALLNLLISEIQSSINHFNAVEADPDYAWMLDNPSGMGPDPVEIDVTDVHFIESPMHLLLALLQGLNAYNLNISSTEPAGIAAALDQDSGFLTLKSGASMASAQTSINNGVAEVAAAAQSLTDETDDQADDLIRLAMAGEDPCSVEDLGACQWPILSEEDLALLLDAAAAVADLLTNPLEIIEDFNSDGTDDTILVNLGVLFSDPIQDWKAILPDYDYVVCGTGAEAVLAPLPYWAATDVSAWTWHPEELNGLITQGDGSPFTSEAMVDLLGLESLFVPGDPCALLR